MKSMKEIIKGSVLGKEIIDMFLDEKQNTWARFDPELGYVLSNYSPRDGIDGSFTISTVQKNGARKQHNYKENPCRINSYGNSFTQCHQVSDGETWQEYLAGHLGEPVRNFGMGGFGVYQAYRRMLRTEKTDAGTEYILFYIWGDDHIRSLFRARHFSNPKWKHFNGSMFHGNCGAHMEMDLDSGKLVEFENTMDTPEKLYGITDPDFMYEVLKDDLMLQMQLFLFKETDDIDFKSIKKLADILEIPFSKNDRDIYRSIAEVKDKYSFTATKYLLDKIVEYTNLNNKKLMILMLDPRVTRSLIMTGERYEQEVVDYITEMNIRAFDMNMVHVEDYKHFNISYDDYRNRYYASESSSHYGPAGNHLFAYSLKKHLIDWLNPKPFVYRDSEEQVIDFDNYLHY